MGQPSGPRRSRTTISNISPATSSALLDHLKIDKAIFVGHDWGGFVVWQMPLRHPNRVAGVVGVNTPHWDRAPADPIELFRQRYGDKMYIVQFQDPAREPDKIFGSRVEQTFDLLMREPMGPPANKPTEPPVSGVGASTKTNLAFPQMVAAYDAKFDPRKPFLSAEEKKVFVDTFTQHRLHRRHQLVPQLDPQLAARRGARPYMCACRR